MKKTITMFAAVLALLMAFAVTACAQQRDTAKPEENTLTGTWEYSDDENGLGAVYVLEEDGTGTYTMKVGEEEVTYELKYETKENHFLVTYVNNDTFTEEDVFDNEFSFKDSKTLIIKDSFDDEMTFVRK